MKTSRAHSRERLKHPAATPPAFRLDERRAGILLHLTSLPGPYGTGDLGRHARRCAEWLQAAQQRWWQMLPVTPLASGPGYSPYSSDSAFAGNAWLIDLEDLARQGLLTKQQLRPTRKPAEGRANYPASIAFRHARLRAAHQRFARSNGQVRQPFEAFLVRQQGWLADYALYCALKQVHGGAPWSQWDPDLRLRKPAALDQARRKLRAEIEFHQFVQYQFNRQWRAFRAYCANRGVGLIGDIPIFVAHDSADVWTNQELFLLDRQGRPKVVTGAPPDAFTSEGQRWGHPQYRWEAHRAQGFRWWLARMGSMFNHFDAVRIDHFLGFHRSWWIPAASDTARKGRWRPGEGEAFFKALQRTFGHETQVFAEDLGRITQGATRLRDRFGLPGMRVMQFGFQDDDDYYRPHVYPPQSVAYTGTHDNDTTAGWHAALKQRAREDPAAQRELERIQTYFGPCAPKDMPWPMIRALYQSQAQTTIVPMQDLLRLGSSARMNTPGTMAGNWRWRLKAGDLSAELAARVRSMTALFGRA